MAHTHDRRGVDYSCYGCKDPSKSGDIVEDATKDNFPNTGDYDNYGAYTEAIDRWERTHVHRTHEGAPVTVGAKFWDNNLRVVEITHVGDGYSRVYGDCPEIQTWHATTGGSSDTMTGGLAGRLARRFEGKDAESYPPGTNYSDVK
jgi:hypothetical protein